MTRNACATRSRKSRDVPRDPERDDPDRDEESCEHEVEEQRSGEEPGEVEALEAGEHVEAGQRADARSPRPGTGSAANMSKKLRTSVLETTVVYVLPGMARCASTMRTASPARAGMIALIPTPARYAP